MAVAFRAKATHMTLEDLTWIVDFPAAVKKKLRALENVA
jgi:hypothetical protein